MPIQYLHFCGGFGATAGQPLRHWELVAIRAAQALHPNATVLLHHQLDSWANAPKGCERVTWSEQEASQWRTWTCKYGAHMSDRVRVLALLKYGGLYQDTDSFMLRNCDELASYDAAAVYQTKGWTVANGFLHAKPGSEWLQLVHDSVDAAGDLPRHTQWDVTSCKLYSKLYRKHKALLTALPWAKYTCSTWHDWDSSFFFGQLADVQRVDNCSVAHAIASGLDYKTKTRLMDEPPAGSTYEYILAKARQTYEGSNRSN